MTKETFENLLPMAETSESATYRTLQFFQGGGQGIEHLLLDDAVARFLRVQLGRIGRQPLHLIVLLVVGH